ncbi:hypothetical protein NJT12_03270 [Flavobacterium sp. AC]|uniref:Uncharacterized protein n=1 Tax=Flavobacterium azizsancarii TaxID=2961580 RepID=A0ABT4W7U2_9FLAO|nr:hypothetical protein [Flavobacterium azizsancarii]MDA6068631.1 hypothetical protein [Flavobacterium azizsancarii]
MNNSNFNQTGGYPLTTERLQELVTGYKIFNAFGSIAGNYTIISGCELVGNTVKDGFIFIDGELLEFKSAVVTPTSTVVIVETQIIRQFENITIQKPVYTYRHATFGTAEISWLWSSFIRPFETKLIQNTFNSFTTLVNNLEKQVNDLQNKLSPIEQKLSTIAEGAEVNVQSDWSVTDILSPAYIKNKIDLSSPFLRKSVFNIGNVGSSGNVNDTKMTVSFPSVGTSNYMVLGALRGRSAFWNDDNDVFWTYGNEQSTSFEIFLREIVANTQDLKFYYVLIPL